MNNTVGHESVARRPRTVALHIGAQQTRIEIRDNDGQPTARLDLAIGAVRTTSAQVRRYPPTPLELENAIMVVEDEVARARALVEGGSLLITNDASVREIARVAGLADQAVVDLPLEVVERTFERLVVVTQGRPDPRLPASLSFAVTLLILREFMHHLRFLSIRIVAAIDENIR